MTVDPGTAGILGAAVIVGVPSLVAAIASIRGNRNVGTSNGQGSLVEMMSAIIREQAAHNAEDDLRFAHEQAAIDKVARELANHTLLLGAQGKALEDRARVHDEINAGVVHLLKTDVLLNVAKDVAAIKAALPRDPELTEDQEKNP